jgi:uncharacterized protein DUF4062
VIDAIKRVKLQHDSMEFFGARSEQPIETCLKEVRASDVIVVIIGHRYGSLAPGFGISFSEAEYQEPIRLKRPCLVYMRDDTVPILPRNMESDPEKMKLLARWKDTLQSRHTISPFQDSGRLRGEHEPSVHSATTRRSGRFPDARESSGRRHSPLLTSPTINAQRLSPHTPVTECSRAKRLLGASQQTAETPARGVEKSSELAQSE